MTTHNLTLAIIIFGALIMLLSIYKFISVIKLGNDILFESNRKVEVLTKCHMVLMCFFFFGYISVFLLIHAGIHLAGNLFTSVIFAFGAIFVLMGIILQSSMLSSIRKQTKELIITNERLSITQDVTIFALAYQAELRDEETGKHLDRTSRYVELLAKELSKLPAYREYLTQAYIADLVKAAPLHDIGKVGIPDSILRKPGKLDKKEFDIMKKHCEYGSRILEISNKKLGFQSFLKIAIQIVRYHHEKWNGQGYPYGLKGEEIPLSARIMALSDVYDALRSERYYKKGMSHEKAAEIILSEKGRHFDPDIVDAFCKISDKFREGY